MEDGRGYYKEGCRQMSGAAVTTMAEGLMSGLSGRVSYNEPMSEHTYLRIGGGAAVYFEPEGLNSLTQFIRRARKGGVPYLVLGGGSNVLFGDGGFEGVVISTKGFRSIETQTTDKGLFIRAGAGVSLAQVVMAAQREAGQGIEGLAGIPGTLGGAVFGNAGSFGAEIKDVVVAVTIVSVDGQVKVLRTGDGQPDSLKFAYRRSGIADNSVIVSVDMRLPFGDADLIAAKAHECVTKKRQTQPISLHSAGCVFKNPVGGYAGELIEHAGCKGLICGGIEVSTVHANFFINRGGGTAADYLSLMERVKAMVQAKFDVGLAPEIRIIGDMA
ncbi:UDP-N-acetylmuramate dehydrogenase [Candidatus Magnetominusculus dajiuhuensis]|uniref:UDP-N-acetylmuramate dehydrogenase n=1 Tax=Candidatus Magnetominusculus dajiuhuensis TaxID=3137712 RepID=UPI003B4397C8